MGAGLVYDLTVQQNYIGGRAMKRKLSGAGFLWFVFCWLGMPAGPACAQGLSFPEDLVAAAFQDPPHKVSGQMFLNSCIVAKDTISAGMQSVDLSRLLRGFEDVAVQIAIGRMRKQTPYRIWRIQTPR